MKGNMIMATYNRNGENNSFNFYTSISASDKISFVRTVVNTIINGDYCDTIIKDLIFNYMIINYFTDIDLPEIDSSDNKIDAIENFIEETNVIDIVKENIGNEIIDELYDAVNDSIEYRTGIHKSPIAESISRLLKTIERKVSGIDTESMMNAAKKISNMSDNLTVDKLIKAYSESDLFKERFKEAKENKEKKNIEQEDMRVKEAKVEEFVKAVETVKTKSKSKKKDASAS